MDKISATGPIKKTALLLFYGWGYNFYRLENQLRADDLLIRSKVCGILAAASAYLKALENAYRRVNLPAPTRDAPFGNKQNLEQARRIERCGVLIEQVSTQIQSAPSPANDKIWQRHRQEAGILETLQQIDCRLTDAAISLHDVVVEWGDVDVANPNVEAIINDALTPLHIILTERRERLTLLV